MLVCVFSSSNDDAKSVRTTSSSAEQVVAEKSSGTKSSVSRQLVDNDSVERTSLTSTDDATTTERTDLHGRRCRSSLGRLLKDAHSDRPRIQHQVRSLPASLSHVTQSSMTPPEANTRLDAEAARSKRQLPPLPGLEVTPPVSLQRGEKEINVETTTTTRSSAASPDDVFVATRDDESATDKRLVDDSTPINAVASASAAHVTSSLPDSTAQPPGDVSGRTNDKNDVKGKRLELDLSAAPSPLGSSVRRTVSKFHPVMRKSASCCELRSLTAAVPRVDSVARSSPASAATSTSARLPPVLQLELGQQFDVVCYKTQPAGTSLAVVNVTAEVRKSTDVDKRDHNDNAGHRHRRLTELARAKTAAAWVSLPTNPRRTVAEEDYYGIGGGCMELEADVIQRTSTNSSCHERQMIFV